MTALLLDAAAGRVYPVADVPVRVRLFTGQLGELVYATSGGYLGVRLDGDDRVIEWPATAVVIA